MLTQPSKFYIGKILRCRVGIEKPSGPITSINIQTSSHILFRRKLIDISKKMVLLSSALTVDVVVVVSVTIQLAGNH